MERREVTDPSLNFCAFEIDYVIASSYFSNQLEERAILSTSTILCSLLMALLSSHSECKWNLTSTGTHKCEFFNFFLQIHSFTCFAFCLPLKLSGSLEFGTMLKSVSNVQTRAITSSILDDSYCLQWLLFRKFLIAAAIVKTGHLGD